MISTYKIAFILLISSLVYCQAQEERKHVRKGNRDFSNEQFEDAEIDYRKAVEKAPMMFETQYNLAAAMLKQEKFEEAIDMYNSLTIETEDKIELSKVYHNMGNAYLQSQKLDQAIDAYKNALRNNPKDNETRYNLAFALDKKRQQMQEQQQKNEEKPPPPSEYAKKLKKQADALVKQRKYGEALRVMKEGEKVDKSMAYYQDFTKRIEDVVKIEN